VGPAVSRLVRGFAGRPVAVETDEQNRPLVVAGSPVLRRHARGREWVGVLGGEPQRDVWLVETERGLFELHYLCHPAGDEDPTPGGAWLLIRRMD
jgi:hypothetical protein